MIQHTDVDTQSGSTSYLINWHTITAICKAYRVMIGAICMVRCSDDDRTCPYDVYWSSLPVGSISNFENLARSSGGVLT